MLCDEFWHVYVRAVNSKYMRAEVFVSIECYTERHFKFDSRTLVCF